MSVRKLYIKNISGSTIDLSSSNILVDGGSINNNEEKEVLAPHCLNGCKDTAIMVDTDQIMLKIDDGTIESVYTKANSQLLISPSLQGNITVQAK